jgi:cell wall-associated NlpC family hydrolase
MAIRHPYRTAAAATVFFLLLSVSSLSYASVEYVIKKGDNPYTIAKAHKIPLQALLSANSIVPKNMKVGTKIVLPANGTTAKTKQKTDRGAKVASAKTKISRPETKAPETAKLTQDNPYHTVKKGETLSSVSKKYAISVSDIKELNNLKSKKLKNGQILLVKHIGPKTYTVKKGDNIWKIAKRFDIDAEDIKTLNELDSHDLKIGQKLYLEEKLDESSTENIQHFMGKNVEEEIKKVAETEEFAEKNTRDKVITFAKKMINIPYKFGGNSILGIDCSAYVKKVYGLLDVDLPRTAREQFKEGDAIDRDELSIGDLVFFRTYASFPSHVGIYLGNNLFIHASSKGRKVTIDSLETPYYLKRFIGGKRLLTETTQETDPKG